VALNRLTRTRDDLTERIEAAEGRVAEVDALFCRPGYFEETPADEVTRLQEERARLEGSVNELTEKWAAVEMEIEAL
jgi:predicted nuclease with TOPRIM domain